jgi:hypothetical protein
MATWSTQPDPINGLTGPDYNSYQVLAVGGTATQRLDAHFGNRLTVLDFGAVDRTGVASAQMVVAAAVAGCYATGDALWWPDGTYLTTASIPNFHDVRHRGPGVLKRGNDLFYVDPSFHPGTTNILYVDTTGSNSNDGLTSAYPRLTCQSAGDNIYKYSYGDVTWKLQFAAGTYVASPTFTKAFPTPNRIQFLGAAVSDGTTPTTIFDATGNGVHGLYLQNSIRAYVEDIKFTDFTLTGTPTANNLMAGLIVDGDCELWTRNVFADGCDVGIALHNRSQGRVQAGRFGATTANGCAVMTVRHSFVSTGYGGSAADANGITGTAMLGGGYGIFSKEWAMNHVDYTYLSTQTLAGVILDTFSRVNAQSSEFVSCLVGIDARGRSNVGHSSTFTTCTTDIAYRGGSGAAGTDVLDSTDISPATKQISTGGTTQSATPVEVFTKTFQGNELQVRGTGFRLRLYCEVTGTAATKTVTVTLGATTLLTAVIAASTTDYEIHVDLCQVTAASSQRGFSRILQNGVTPTLNYVTSAEDMTIDKTLTVTHQVTNVADLNRIGFIELEIGH